jgi:hypothetical protein
VGAEGFADVLADGGEKTEGRIRKSEEGRAVILGAMLTPPVNEFSSPIVADRRGGHV